MGRVKVWARPGSRRDRIVWDAWRDRWVVHCRDPAQHGKANEAILRFIADQLGVSLTTVRYVTAGRVPSKLIEVDGLSDSEIGRRLERVAAPSDPSRWGPESPPARSGTAGTPAKRAGRGGESLK